MGGVSERYRVREIVTEWERERIHGVEVGAGEGGRGFFYR